jgi:hypothetical protein
MKLLDEPSPAVGSYTDPDWTSLTFDGNSLSPQGEAFYTLSGYVRITNCKFTQFASGPTVICVTSASDFILRGTQVVDISSHGSAFLDLKKAEIVKIVDVNCSVLGNQLPAILISGSSEAIIRLSSIDCAKVKGGNFIVSVNRRYVWVDHCKLASCTAQKALYLGEARRQTEFKFLEVRGFGPGEGVATPVFCPR